MLKPNTVAIVTRTKNRNVLLKRALDSVASQTHSDFVHIVLNDGGDKKAVENLVSEYSHNIKLIHNNKSKGLTPALNQGIQAAKTKYIAILDDDDSWDERYLELTVGHLEDTGARGVVAVIDKVVEKVEGGKVAQISVERWRPDIDSVTLYGQCIDNYAPTVAFVYQRDVYEELGGYDESLRVSEDWEFTIRFLLKHDIDFLHTKRALAYYHHRPEAKGDVGNSVFARVDQHNYHMNMLANHFLRKDINEGKFGIGYIINSLRYNRNTLVPEQMERDIEQTVRLEAHTNMLSERLQKNQEDDLGYILGRRLKNLLRRK